MHAKSLETAFRRALRRTAPKPPQKTLTQRIREINERSHTPKAKPAAG
jgi:hypothetical protein